MWLERISGGGDDLIDLADAKAHLRVLEDDFDAEIATAIRSASAFLDVDADGHGGLGFPLITQLWATKAAQFSNDLLRLPFLRVNAVTGIDYTAPDGSPGVVPASDYSLTRQGRFFVVALLPGKSWPEVIDRPDAISLNFSAGWPDAANVPADIKAAARLLVGHFFENRQEETQGPASAQLKLGVERLTHRYRAYAG